ncbi:MAG: hypothetical protein ACR2P5_04505 [Gammaproteobacteria bacterium]
MEKTPYTSATDYLPPKTLDHQKIRNIRAELQTALQELSVAEHESSRRMSRNAAGKINSIHRRLTRVKRMLVEAKKPGATQ